jgi:lipopolysaccharide export system protein LptA
MSHLLPAVRNGSANARRRPARRWAAAALLPLAVAACIGRAETGDREKPIHYSADSGDVNYQTKIGTLTGNVVVTQGTMSVHADKLVLKQNPDNSVSVDAYGNPVSFRQKRDGVDEYFEGYAQHAQYDGTKQFLQLFDHALLRRGQDEIRSNYITYNVATEVFKAEGRPASPSAPPEGGPGARVRGVFQPRAESPPGASAAAPTAAAGQGAPKAEPPLDVKLKPSGTLAAPPAK